MKLLFSLSLVLGLLASLGCEKEIELNAKGSESFSGALPSKARYVQTVKAEKRPFDEEVPVVGVFTPSKVISLHFAVAGRLTDCSVEEGDLVKKGEVLCSLDSSVIDLEVSRARSGVQAAETILSSNFIEKQKQLFDAGIIGQSDFERIRVQNETAQAEYGDAQVLLELALKKKQEHILVAPWSGRVSKMNLNAGQLVSPAVTVGLLETQKALKIDVKLHASWYGKVTKGHRGEIDSIAGVSTESPINAVVTHVSQSVDAASQMFTVSLDLVGSNALKETSQVAASGMIARGTLFRRITENGLVLPASTLVRWQSDNKAQAFAVDENGRLKLVDLSIAAYSDDLILVKSGIEETDQLVRRFSSDLYIGLPIRSLETSFSTKKEIKKKEVVK